MEYIHEESWNNLPTSVRGQARRCLLDTISAAIGGRRTELSRIIHDFAASVYRGEGAPLWLDGREVSPPGAALANGMTVDSLDIHDGYSLAKGHAGAALVPAALATLGTSPEKTISGKELLTTLAIGYEIALRAGVALHATARDYHSSGAWNALGCAAIAARRSGLSVDQTRHALGIAEYHGPRSPMMRCIEHPSMLKDGSGWGAMTGVSAALLAQNGFTGVPASTIESSEVGELWSDLGERWLITAQYFKPQAVCRWAQPAVTGALAAQRANGLTSKDIKRIEVLTFSEAARLDCRQPRSTEEAQYSLPFAVAAALVYGRLGSEELDDDALGDRVVVDLANRVEPVEEPAFNARFPAERLSRVRIETTDGCTHDSGEVEARWEASSPPTDAELREKFRWLAHSHLPGERAAALEHAAWRCSELPDAASLVDSLALPQEE
ncbi:MAG: MmgE/PrpD family protein [Actinomycetota bacterium]|nr:MmgE/PrpD family protein [Actinomycetota bacterium]